MILPLAGFAAMGAVSAGGKGTALAIGSLALSAVSAFAGIQQARSAAKAQAAAMQANADATYAEMTRQQEEINEAAQDDRSEVIRKADQELSTLRVAASEFGATPGSHLRLMTEIASVEGTDLARIESNRKGAVDARQAAKKAAQVGAQGTVTTSYNRAGAEILNSTLGFVGSGLQIASSEYRNQQYLKSLKG